MSEVIVESNTPEEVAYKLLKAIANAENINLYKYGNGADKDWILKNYADCLDTVRRATYNPAED